VVGGLVVVSAVLISLSTIYTLVVTQIKGTTNGGQTESENDKAARWQFTTQWSIPKLESLRVIIPGLFGYRMQEFTTSTNKAGSYWGKIAEDPHIQDLESSDPQVRTNAIAALGISPQPELQASLPARHGGSRRLCGTNQGPGATAAYGQRRIRRILVCLLAAFGLANAGRKAGSPYPPRNAGRFGFGAARRSFPCWRPGDGIASSID
jgi:hypothetical protein